MLSESEASAFPASGKKQILRLRLRMTVNEFMASDKAIFASENFNFLGCESGSSSHFFLQSLQRAQDQLPAEFFFLFRGQIGIPRRADDAAGRNRAERTDFLGHWNQGADLSDWNFQFFDFFADRCAAASARSSGRSKNHTGDAGLLEALGDVLADARGVLDGGVSAAGGMDELVDLADYAVALKLAHRVQRH
jgi:hypothetical protein